MDSAVKIKQNLDTNFLKLIAIVSMTIDHVSKVFFPDNMALAILGRIAFPLFAYCLVVGCLYTRDIKKYILRLALFALISQPFYLMAFHPNWGTFWYEFSHLNLNIFFTLLAGVLVVSALMDIKRRWWMIIVALAGEIFIGFDYGLYGLGLMAIFYICRKNSWLSALLSLAWMLFNGMRGDFLYIGSFGLDLQFFAILALPLIYIHTHFNPRINKYFFYAFYPAHFLLIFILRMIFHV